MTRLLLGYDGSATAGCAISVAHDLFGDAEAVIAVIHTAAGTPDGEGDGSAVLAEGAAYARSLGLDAHAIHAESGYAPWQPLLTVARHHRARAVVVGSRGRGAVSSTVLGSVASALVHAAAVPVIVVPRGRGALAPARPGRLENDRTEPDSSATA